VIAMLPNASVGLLLLCIAIFGGTSFTLYPLSLAHAGDRLVNNEDMVGLSSGMLLLYSGGAVLGPLIGGQVLPLFNGGGLFLFTAAVSAATVAFGLWRMRIAPPSETDQVEFVAVPRTSAASTELDPRSD
jgi:MFS family permease